MISAILAKGNNVYDFLFACLHDSPSKMGSTVKRKNLLLGEQILSFKC